MFFFCLSLIRAEEAVQVDELDSIREEIAQLQDNIQLLTETIGYLVSLRQQIQTENPYDTIMSSVGSSSRPRVGLAFGRCENDLPNTRYYFKQVVSTSKPARRYYLLENAYDPKLTFVGPGRRPRQGLAFSVCENDLSFSYPYTIGDIVASGKPYRPLARSFENKDYFAGGGSKPLRGSSSIIVCENEETPASFERPSLAQLPDNAFIQVGSSGKPHSGSSIVLLDNELAVGPGGKPPRRTFPPRLTRSAI